MAHKKEVKPGGREGVKELRGVDGGETVISVYNVRKKNLMSIKGKNIHAHIFKKLRKIRRTHDLTLIILH